MKNNFKILKKLFHKNLLFSLLALSFFGCGLNKLNNEYEKTNIIDRETGLTQAGLKKQFIADKSQQAKNQKEFNKNITPAPIPRISRMLSLPAPPKVGSNQLISFSITDQVPLKDVLVELGRATGLDVDIDPLISGGIIINATDRPLEEIIERIVDKGHLRYSYKNNVLFFERDLPYIKHYAVDYLIDGTLWGEVETAVTNIASSFDSSLDSSITAYSISSNMSAGLITIFANSKKQGEIAQYLKVVRRNASAQVLIEAKVIEVTLNDSYKTGIDWDFGGDGNVTTNTGLADADAAVFTAIISGATGRIGATVSALETFGDVRAISSPRINALNNQAATLDFVNKLVYFTIEIQTDTATDTDSSTSTTSTTVSSTQVEEDVGVKLEITPSIDLDANEIVLKVIPTISIKSSEVEDPATYINNDGVETATGNVVPVIQTRQLETTMKINDGGILVIGGLMQEDTTNLDTAVPYLSKIPFIGSLFKTVSKVTKITETVIFIKATIIHIGDEVDEYDRNFNDVFTANPKKFF